MFIYVCFIYAGCAIRFLPPVDRFSDLQQGGSFNARIDVRVVIGLGCYCTGTCGGQARPLTIGARSFQGDGRVTEEVRGETFVLVVPQQQEQHDDSPSFFAIILRFIIDIILTLFGG